MSLQTLNLFKLYHLSEPIRRTRANKQEIIQIQRNSYLMTPNEKLLETYFTHSYFFYCIFAIIALHYYYISNILVILFRELVFLKLKELIPKHIFLLGFKK